MKKKQKAVKSSLTRNRDLQGWIFVSPLVVGIVFLFIGILFNSIRFCFGTLKLGQVGFDLDFVGLANINEALFVNPTYTTTMVGSVWNVVLSIPVTLIFSLFIAVLLNQKMVGRAFFRAIFFVPVILSVGFVEKAASGDLMLSAMTNGVTQVSQEAATNTVLSGMNIENYLRNLSFSPTIVNFVVSLVDSITTIINQSGVQILIFLAGLQSISPSIYESASIEGATQSESFWKITLPMIFPMVMVNAIYTVIDFFTRSSNPVMSLIDKTAFSETKYGVAAAMSWIYFVVIAVVLAAVCGVLYLIATLAGRRKRR